MATFWGVGVGPGDPELLTLKARRVLSEAPVVFCARAVGDEALAQKALLAACSLRGELRELDFPMLRDRKALADTWRANAGVVAQVLGDGRDAAFATLGDTAIYSSYMNFLAQVRQQAPAARVVTVPGISSFSAAAARADLALVEGGQRLAVLPALDDVEALRPDLERFDTVVLMKVGRRFAALRALLDQMGLLNQAHLFAALGSEHELVTSDLAPVDPATVGYMSLVIVKKSPLEP